MIHASVQSQGPYSSSGTGTGRHRALFARTLPLFFFPAHSQERKIHRDKKQQITFSLTPAIERHLHGNQHAEL